MKITVAAAQLAPVLLDREATLFKVEDAIRDAASNGIDLLAFPETIIPGWPAWVFDTASWEHPGAKRAYARLIANSVEVPSETTVRLCALARRHRIFLVVGINEVDLAFPGTVFNSLLFIDRAGEIREVHRKLVPTHAERIVWGQGDGSTLQVIPTDFGRVGGLICWEHWMPLARFALHSQREEIHIAAWPEAIGINEVATRHYAFEGRCFVVCAASYMAEEHIPVGFELADAVRGAGGIIPEEGVILPGGSGVVAPNGEWIVGPVTGCEQLVSAEIDLETINEEYLALDVAGHYNRPDIFDVRIDNRPRRPVTWRVSAGGREKERADAASNSADLVTDADWPADSPSSR